MTRVHLGRAMLPLVAALAAAGLGPAHATVTNFEFTGTNAGNSNSPGPLSAKADFSFDSVANSLTVSLFNTQATDASSLVNGDVLSAVFFDFNQATNVQLTGSTLDMNGSTFVDTAKFTAAGITTLDPADEHWTRVISNNTIGISATGYSGNSGISQFGSGDAFASGATFAGQQSPYHPVPDGADYSLVHLTSNTTFIPTSDSKGLYNNGPLIDNQVNAHFNLTNYSFSGLSAGSISNVYFQYGTGAGEAYFQGTRSVPTPAPEPGFIQFGTMLALGGLAAPLRRLRARRK